MLKFADLSVDFKSYENSLNSYMKLFPGSYTPLLIMYLAHKGLLKLVSEFEENDPRILVSVDGKSLHDFFGDGIMKELIQDTNVWDHTGTFEETVELMNKAILKDRDVYVMLPFIHLWPLIIAGRSIALIADVAEDDQIKDLIDCITISDRASDNHAALMFFSVMLMMKYGSSTEADGNESRKPEEIEYHKRLEQGIWIEDFEYTLSKILSYSSEKEWCQPKELTRVMLTQYKGGSIYNPFAGLASYAVQMQVEPGITNRIISSNNIGDNYYGDEINRTAWAIGKLRLLAYGADSCNYNCYDSTKWRKGIVNNIFCTPPFGFRIENEEGKKEYAENFVIRRGLDMLSDGGLLACVVPLTFLNLRGSEIIKRIIDNGWLESVVYLPEKLFENTEIRTVILFIRKSAHEGVKFINATGAANQKNSRQNILDEEIVANLLYHDSYPSVFEYDSRAIMEEELPQSKFEKMKFYASNKKIVNSHYDLSPGRYFLDSVSVSEGYKLISIEDVAIGIPGNAGLEGTGKIITPSILSRDIYTPLEFIDIPDGTYKTHYKVLDKDAILYSAISAGHPTLFKCSEGEKAYIDPTKIGAVFLSSEKVLPEYVLLEITKPYVQEQMKLLARGGVVSRLMVEDFLMIRIQIPNSWKQALSLEKEAYDNAKALHFSKINEELAKLKDQQHSEYVKMLRQRKHRIQQVMNELSPAFSLLNQFRKENGGMLHDSDIIAARTGKTAGEYFDRLETIVSKVEDMVTNLVDKEPRKHPVPVDIVQFVNDIPLHHISDKFIFQIDDNYYKTGKSEGILPFFTGREVMIDPDDLSEIFDNIIDNALKYGFTDAIRKDYVIRIILIGFENEDHSYVRIDVTNNGTPIHPSVDRNRFFDWGYGSGTGLGTWQIKTIAEHYGGDVSLNEYPDNEAGFQTQYVIKLPLIDKSDGRRN